MPRKKTPWDRILLGVYKAPPARGSNAEGLTPEKVIPMSKHEPTYREQRALQLLAQGLNNREIAEKMGVSEHTVSAYLQSLMTKLDANHRGHLVALAFRAGLLSVDDDHASQA